MTGRTWTYFALVFVVLVAADQWTKYVASTRLASQRLGHFLKVEVSEDGTVEDALTKALTANTPDQIKTIAERYTIDGQNRALRSTTPVHAGEKIFVKQRRIEVIPGYFDFSYTRNKGAAFGSLADEDASFRVPFFTLVTLIAIAFILAMVRGLGAHQIGLIAALAMILGGAVGNFIDRMLHGWVIDFIVWKYTDAFRWPTFNVADMGISIGSALILVLTIREAMRSRKRAQAYAVQCEDEEE